MEKVVEFIKELVKEMEDCHWQISSVVEFEVVEEDEDLYAKIDSGLTLYKEQDGIYIQQSSHGEDNYYGVIIKPITDKLALKIHYEC